MITCLLVLTLLWSFVLNLAYPNSAILLEYWNFKKRTHEKMLVISILHHVLVILSLYIVPHIWAVLWSQPLIVECLFLCSLFLHLLLICWHQYLLSINGEVGVSTIHFNEKKKNTSMYWIRMLFLIILIYLYFLLICFWCLGYREWISVIKWLGSVNIWIV